MPQAKAFVFKMSLPKYHNKQTNYEQYIANSLIVYPKLLSMSPSLPIQRLHFLESTNKSSQNVLRRILLTLLENPPPPFLKTRKPHICLFRFRLVLRISF